MKTRKIVQSTYTDTQRDHSKELWEPHFRMSPYEEQNTVWNTRLLGTAFYTADAPVFCIGKISTLENNDLPQLRAASNVS